MLTAEAISNSVRGGLARTGAGYFDVLMLDEAAFETLAPDAQGYLADLRAAGLVLQMGVVGMATASTPVLRAGCSTSWPPPSAWSPTGRPGGGSRKPRPAT
uniref:Uncharacterized protein n=1 Tax=Phenylobacterium glaciei TaxID=2803784 RepID=A0A974SA23_9CAUL|nr:hypothetical protein JKL49_10900 [Phenylobacterium glaciei]